MNAATVVAANWWAAERADAANWVTNYQKSLTARHRLAISAIVGDVGAKTVLEVGCHCAPNLMRLAEDYQDVTCFGVDVNQQAIAAATTWAAARGVSDRVKVATASFPTGTASLGSQQYDVVLSCYSLAYISPADLDGALYELGRLARKAVIVAEPMRLDGQTHPKATMISNGYSEWRHDYLDALEWINTMRGWTTRIVPVSPPIDRLNAILVVQNDDVSGGNTP